MQHVELRRKDELYKIWYRFMQLQRERVLLDTQNNQVAVIGEQVNYIGQLSDYVEK